MIKLVVCWVLVLLSVVVSLGRALFVPLSAARPKESLAGISLPRVLVDGDDADSLVDLGEAIGGDNGSRTMVVFATHAGDFNTIEYLQKIRFALHDLQAKGSIGRFLVVVNGGPDQIRKLAGLLDAPRELEWLSDPTGEAGRAFGVDRGFRPDDDSLPPLAKQFATGIGIGPPWGTLPAVLPGYTGNPSGKRDWIEEALLQGQKQGRWPSVLEVDDNDVITSNRFDEAPLVSGWGRRPFELATLRLQSLIGIQIRHWSELKPLDDRCLTQLGGCTVVEADGTPVYSWLDKGLCDVPDFDEVVEALSPPSNAAPAVVTEVVEALSAASKAAPAAGE
jgi:hypothetical protein